LRRRFLSGLGYRQNQAKPATGSTSPLQAVVGSNHSDFADSLM
jgi:hypothetical protein